MQVDVAGDQVEVTIEGPQCAVGGTLAVGAGGACKGHVAVAGGQGEVTFGPDLAPRQCAAGCCCWVDDDVALALNDRQIGGAHQHRGGVEREGVARLDTGLSADFGKAGGGGAHSLHSGVVQRQVPGFVEDRSRAAADMGLGMGLCAFAGKAQHVFGHHMCIEAGDTSSCAGT